MVRAIVWKEFREQGLIGLTLLVLGSGVLVAAAVLADPPTDGASVSDVLRFFGAGRLATLLLAVTAGTVCGGALFAAEREAGTLGFLAALPASRWDIWVGKLAAGVALVVCQVGPLLFLAGLLGLVESGRAGLQLGLSALHAFVWGMLGSTIARTTLGSVGVAIPAAVLAAFLYGVPVFLLFHNPRTNAPRPEGGLVLLALMFSTPLAVSAFVFTRADRERAADDRTPAFLPAVAPEPMAEATPARRVREPGGRRGARFGLKALLWLAGRQLLLPGLVGSAFALGFGLVLLLPLVQPVLVWPPLALAAGVLAGVTVFSDEQAHGTARFWGERRLPVGRAWAVKAAVHALFALWLVALLGLPVFIQSQAANELTRPESAVSAAFRTRLFDGGNLGGQGWKFLLVPVAYGFVAGHLCGLLFKKAVVATGVAGLVGGTAAALWGPSLLAGGVYHWQLWAPAAAALVTARLMMRPWGADRGLSRPALTTLAAGGAVAALVLAAGIGVRAVEVPDDPAGEDDRAYVAGLPAQEENVAGRTFRAAAEQFGRVALAAAEQAPAAAARGATGGTFEAQLEQVPLQGLKETNLPLNQWLDDLYAPGRGGGGASPWFAEAAAAAELPTGLFEHPQLAGGTAAGLLTMDHGRRMGAALIAHGLQRQNAGDPAPFVADLRTDLALGRNFRNGSGVAALRQGQAVTRAALFGVDQWLANLDGRPDLIRQVLEAVREDDRAVPTRWGPGGVTPASLPPAGDGAPFDPTPHLLADRFLVRGLLTAPAQWLPDNLAPPGQDREAQAPVADLVGFGWATPWERERTRRLVGLGPDRRSTVGMGSLVRGRPGSGLLLRTANPDDLTDQDRFLRSQRRATILKLAVRAYQAEHGGTPPADLAALVPAYLPAVPTDPYGDGPFRYRVVRLAEVPAAVRLPNRPLADGDVLVWSVGPNGKDDGGWAPPYVGADQSRHNDHVYLLPRRPG